MWVMKVGGMTCGHCEQAVKRALEAVSNIRVIEIDREQERVVVEGEADRQLLLQAVVDEGYSAEFV